MIPSAFGTRTGSGFLRTSGAKLLLVGLGLALLYSVAQGPGAPLLLCFVSAAAYGAGRWLHRRATGRVHALVGRLAVPVAFAALVLLNVTGLIGTLTGAQSTLAQGAALSLVAVPFYLLSAAAFLCDMALRRGKLPAPLDFFVFMALPFKLLAGPLETPRLIEQIQAMRLQWRSSRVLAAWPWVAMGAFMKYVIANRLDPARHLVHTDPVTSFVTAAIFELKFYFDFAGYSFMAYGAALALGLKIHQNFNHPFLTPNVVLFWRNWHISLGRFLTRYVLEPNLSLWNGRTQKMVFASSIFLVSAMWHGGTLNYLLWGLFHGLCYFAYGQWFKRRDVPGWAGLLAMLAFFVFGRMFAVDADSQRLLERLANFFDPTSYAWAVQSAIPEQAFFSTNEVHALTFAALFLAAEVVNQKLYGHRRGYHLLRRPWFASALLLLFVVLGLDTGTLLYARI